jgi:hypothetical protein
MRVRVINTGTEPVSIPIDGAQAQLEAILAQHGWDERLQTGFNFARVLTCGEQAQYPVARFTQAQLEALDKLREDGKVTVIVE